MTSKIEILLNRFIVTISRYPILLLNALMASITIISADAYSNSDFLLIKLFLVLLLGNSLLFGLTTLSQKEQNRTLLPLFIGLPLMAAFYFLFLPENQSDFSIIHRSTLVISGICCHLFVAFGPFLRKYNERNFWNYNKNLFISVILTAIFTGVLVGGAQLAITAVDQLFTLNFPNELYLYSFYFLSIFGSMLIFLLFIEEGYEKLIKEDTYPIVLKFFTQFILIPLLLIYLIILYAYTFKILLNWDLPEGWVTILIIAYSSLGLLALLLVEPLKSDNKKSWVNWFSKMFYYSLLPLMILWFVAILTRINEYGFTINRYFVLLTACWLCFIALYNITNQQAKIIWIPLGLFLVGLLGIITPHFNAFSVSERSQSNRLETILIKNNLLKNNYINFSSPVVDTVVEEIDHVSRFFIKRNQEGAVLKWIAPEKRDSIDNGLILNYYSYKPLGNLFTNLIRTENKIQRNSTTFSLKAKNHTFEINSYKYLIPTIPRSTGGNDLEDYSIIFKTGEENTIFLNSSSGSLVAHYSLNSTIDSLISKYVRQINEYNRGYQLIEMNPESVSFQLGPYSANFVFQSIFKNENETTYDGYLLLR